MPVNHIPEPLAEISLIFVPKDLAQEIMEDVSPQEGEEIESCFVSPSDEDEMEQEEDEKQGGAEHGGESDEMVLIQDQP